MNTCNRKALENAGSSQMAFWLELIDDLARANVFGGCYPLSSFMNSSISITSIRAAPSWFQWDLFWHLDDEATIGLHGDLAQAFLVGFLLSAHY